MCKFIRTNSPRLQCSDSCPAGPTACELLAGMNTSERRSSDPNRSWFSQPRHHLSKQNKSRTASKNWAPRASEEHTPNFNAFQTNKFSLSISADGNKHHTVCECKAVVLHGGGWWAIVVWLVVCGAYSVCRHMYVCARESQDRFYNQFARRAVILSAEIAQQKQC